MGNIVLVWAGGTGMSGIGGILQELGFANIVCIDGSQSQLTDNLKTKWLKVIIGHGKYEPKIDDVVIYSEAAAESSEVTKAKQLIRDQKKMMLIMNYFQFLGEVSKYFTTIGISGTNGKSSTAALTIYGAKDIPNFWLGILGSLVPDFNNQSYLINPTHKEEIKSIFIKIFTGKFPSLLREGLRMGLSSPKSLLFIVEACEYKRHFLNLDLDYAAITNLEYDHADYYKTYNDYQQAFKEMLTKLKKKCFVLKWFLKSNPEFTFFENKIEEVEEIEYQFKYIFWPHTNKNASLTLALLSNVPKTNLSNFKWLRRRLEYLGKTENWAKIFSDYGHMASSITIGYKALHEHFPNQKIAAIFQPHQITRIFTGRNDFIQSFKGFDEVIIYDIYAAREDITHFDFSSKGNKIHNIEDLWNTFAKACNGIYYKDRKSLKHYIENSKKDTIIVIFSAGDIDYKLRTDVVLK